MSIRHTSAVALLGAGALLALLVGFGAVYEGVSRARLDDRYPAPGRLVDIGGRRIHLDCRGFGSPTVVLEAGLDHMGSLSWAAVHDSMAATTRVCAYSRAGIMWSDPSPMPFSAAAAATDLHAALVAAGEQGPWILAAHSIGGPYAMVFTKKYPADVAGLVLVDASHPDQFARFQQAAGKDLKPTPGAAAIGARLAWSGLVRPVPAGAPPNTPPAAIAAAGAFLPTSLTALVGETKALDVTMTASGEARDLGDRPLIVLTAMKEMSPELLKVNGITPEQGERLREASKLLHDDEATWSRHGTNELIADATHYIQLDRPDIVVGAVRRMVEGLRSATSARE
jgi:pimeloyl-ACP methyl ester carboxylesterase